MFGPTNQAEKSKKYSKLLSSKNDEGNIAMKAFSDGITITDHKITLSIL